MPKEPGIHSAWHWFGAFPRARFDERRGEECKGRRQGGMDGWKARSMQSGECWERSVMGLVSEGADE